MSLNYGYLFSTEEVAKDFGRYDNFARDKKAFESIPNIIISRSMDNDLENVDVPEILLDYIREPPRKAMEQLAEARYNKGGRRA
ncbi:hypothetical protein PV04_07406 [Phialophora macrospora]|uniref:Uncharacterized protein n=1 Tax=Phialophora macrospora TaxID=1851006 RepID=A0A0D2FAU8_9EURO|nr:hypothetical protein PV04_07406 [Phialophora macrospora]